MAVALIHHPVTDKNGQTIAAAVTSLDLHDIARAAKTYGVEAFYVVTPLLDQQELVASIIDHWVTGAGAQYNPDRRTALALIRMEPTLQAAMQDMAGRHGAKPCSVVTSARMDDSNLDDAGLRGLVRKGGPVLLIFGTGWGLAPQLIAQADYRLAPIQGHGEFNHLSVRSAVSIVLDRLFR
ncbi:MAG: RNA methyltransferase [Desulfobacteraceae bacterium]|nr:MAG: RNA methyltransferase [Desulfobacteraceae bacterium]